MELSDLYSDRILHLAANLPSLGRLPNPDASARKVSRVCGSVVEIDLSVEDGRIAAYGHEISACALGQTSASVMAQQIVGATPEELRRVRSQMLAMLKDNGPPPTGERWADLKFLEPVRDYTPRHTSTMLVFDAVVAALDTLEEGK